MSRDESIAGYPLTAGDQIVLFSRTRVAVTYTVIATTYDPTTDITDTQSVLTFAATNTSFGQETTFTTFNFKPGTILVAAVITSTVGTVSSVWGSIELFRNSQSVGWLCGGWLNGSGTPSWVAGNRSQVDSPFANASNQGALFTFQGTVVNGAGGAGDNTLTVTAAAGARVKLLTFRIVNNDTAARVSSLVVDDGTNLLHLLGFNSALGAANNQAFPSVATTDAASFAGNGAEPGIWIAGSNRLVGTLAAVAASQDSAWAMTCLVWGAAPTCTLAGASTPTLTTNTSRVEGG